MSQKTLTIVCTCAAVISAAVAGIVITNNRATIARAKAERAESAANKAASEAKKAKLVTAAEEAASSKAKSEAKAAEEKRKAAELEERTAKENALAEREGNERATKEAAAAHDKAVAAADERAAETAKANAAKADLEAIRVAVEGEIAKSNAAVRLAEAANEAARLALEKKQTEEKILIAKQTEFTKWQQDLEQYAEDLKAREVDVAERERALVPDKTAEDLVWLADGEADEIGGETNKTRRARARIRPEDDKTLPPSTRLLSNRERLQYERDTNRLARVRAKIVGTLEPLMIQAIKDDRIVDADFYYKTLKKLYPDWYYKRDKE